VLRSDDIYSELPDDYSEPVIDELSGEECDSNDANLESENTDIESSASSAGSDSDSDTIPEVTVQDMVNLATQIMQNEQNTNSGLRNGSVRFRFPQHFDHRDVDLAREIIVRHERNSDASRLASNDGQYYIHPLQTSNTSRPSVLVRFRDDQDTGNNMHVRFNRNSEQPFWMSVTDFLTVALMMLILLRIVRSTLSVTSFSSDILQDTFDYIDQMREETAGSTGSLQNTITASENLSRELLSGNSMNSTLIMRFGGIIDNAFPALRPPYKAVITVFLFYIYTMVSSGFLIASLIFSGFCFTLSVGKRWQDVKKFVAVLWQDGENCV